MHSASIVHCTPFHAPPLVALTCRVRAVAETVACLIQAVRDGKDIDLNVLKSQVSRKYNIARCGYVNESWYGA
jgi:elongator complex protein 3